VLIPVARKAVRSGPLPVGSGNVVEVLVVFVRDMIARPALRENTYRYLPFLLTLFVFVLGMNLFSLLPLAAIVNATPLPPIGGSATSIAAVCGSLAALVLATILLAGLRRHVAQMRASRGWSLPVCALLAPVMWFVGLSPNADTVRAKIAMLPVACLELLGILAKCFSLTVRLCANMLSGHALLVVLMMFILRALGGFLTEQASQVFYVAPICILASVLVCILELLVGVLQAYIFTFLCAMFLGLYAEESH
jgi:F-type H+-transporting ATPase subunit a